MEQEDIREPEQEQEQKPAYVPRPAWQVWCARIGLVIVIISVVLYYLHIARGGL